MRRFVALLLTVPFLAHSQTALVTEFPSGAVQLTADDLKRRLTGNTFLAKPATGPDIRTQYQEKYVFLNMGSTNDSGTWRVDGSTVCFEWRQIRPSCSEVRREGDVLYLKRANNGEVLTLQQR